jgi:hypothetical protein
MKKARALTVPLGEKAKGPIMTIFIRQLLLSPRIIPQNGIDSNTRDAFLHLSKTW